MIDADDLPEGWCWCVLSDIAEVKSGLAKGKRRDEATNVREVPYLRVANVQRGFIDLSEVKTIAATEQEIRQLLLLRGDILFNEGGDRDKLGRGWVWNGELEECIHQNHVFRARLRSDKVEPRYVSHYANSAAQDYFLGSAKQTTNLASINRSQLEQLPIPLPPFSEQRRIVERIEALQARSRKVREALEAIPPLLEHYRQSVLASAFRGDLTADWREQHPDIEPASALLDRIRQERRRLWEEKNPRKKYIESEPVDDSDLPGLPEGWCWAKWCEVGFCQNGSAFPSSSYSDSGVKLLRPGNLHVSGQLVWNSENTRYLPNEWEDAYRGFIVGPNEIVMNLTAQSLKDEFLGRVCLSGAEERCLLNQRLARITPVILSPQFCLYLFKSPVFRRFVDDLNTGSLIQHMFTSQVYAFTFPLPPVEEQAEIVKGLERHLRGYQLVEQLANNARDECSRLDQSILAKAFRGELVEQDPADEPASVLLDRIRAERNGSSSSSSPRRKIRR